MRAPAASRVEVGWPASEPGAPEFGVCGYVVREYESAYEKGVTLRLREPRVLDGAGSRVPVRGHLGSGSAGHVYLVGKEGASFAVKVVLSDESDEDRAGFRLWCEMRDAGMRCAGLFVPASLEEFDDMACFGMPLGDTTLSSAVNDGTLRPAAAAEAVGRALHLLQISGYAYCDLKPSNVLVLRRGQTAHLVFCDLGSLVRGGGRGLATYPPPGFPSGVNVPATDRAAAWSASVLLVTLVLGHLPKLAYEKDGERFSFARERAWSERVESVLRAAAARVGGAASAAVLACLEKAASLQDVLPLLQAAAREEEESSNQSGVAEPVEKVCD